MVLTILYDFSIYYWITTGRIIIMNGNEMRKNNIVRYKTASSSKDLGKFPDNCRKCYHGDLGTGLLFYCLKGHEPNKNCEDFKAVIDCNECKWHDWDWKMCDGFVGEAEYEVCLKGQELYGFECEYYDK